LSPSLLSCCFIFNAVFLVYLEVKVLGCFVYLRGLTLTQHFIPNRKSIQKIQLVALGFSVL